MATGSDAHTSCCKADARPCCCTTCAASACSKRSVGSTGSGFWRNAKGRCSGNAQGSAASSSDSPGCTTSAGQRLTHMQRSRWRKLNCSICSWWAHQLSSTFWASNGISSADCSDCCVAATSASTAGVCTSTKRICASNCSQKSNSQVLRASAHPQTGCSQLAKKMSPAACSHDLPGCTGSMGQGRWANKRWCQSSNVRILPLAAGTGAASPACWNF